MADSSPACTWGRYALYVQENRLHYVNSLLVVDSDPISSDTAIPLGTAATEDEFIKTGERELATSGPAGRSE